MYLKGLEINGFKSFAKKSNLEFTSAISAIVGPNGSGKSNIAEAFRFVLGEQSIKSLRGKKGEDLIFNGSADTGRSNRASVKVIFDNRKRFLNIDFDEVSLERVVHRDSVNEYFINGSQARLKDIIELLSGAHIGSSGHHIISQGEADKILNANLKDRRAMIEDALGLKIYQYKRQESERKLGKTQDNIASVESLRKEVAPHLRFLKKQMEKVEKTLQMKDELLGLYLEYLKREDDYIKFTHASNVAERAPLQKELHKLEAELASAKKILEGSTGKDKKSIELILLEEKIHVEGQVPKEKIAELMAKHLKSYLGPDVDVTRDGGYFYVYWSHIRNFFYVYTYAYGQIISRALYEKWKADPSYAKKIKEFLSAGRSMSPENIFKAIGIDTSKTSFFEDGLKGIERDIDRLEKLTSK